jgi:hypothetical protein
MVPLAAVSVASERTHIEVETLMLDAYEATKPDPVGFDWPNVNLTIMYPLFADREPGKVVPLNGLPASSVMDAHANVLHEYTRTRSWSCRVLKLTNESVTKRPGEEMVTEQVEEICAMPSPVPPDIVPLNAVSVAPDGEQIEFAEASLETEYDAMNPEAVTDSSDVNVTFIIPVREDTE